MSKDLRFCLGYDIMNNGLCGLREWNAKRMNGLRRGAQPAVALLGLIMRGFTPHPTRDNAP